MNSENLIPLDKRTKTEQKEITRMGGIASGAARRAKRDRHKRIQELFALAVQDPKILKTLESYGIDANGADLETAADARVLIEILKKGDYKAWQAMKEEAYGKQENKTALEVSGEVSGININIKKFDGDSK